MEDHPREIQTVWIYKPNENGNPPEMTQTTEIKHVQTRYLWPQAITAGEPETLKINSKLECYSQVSYYL
jgi:hypothetical protein